MQKDSSLQERLCLLKVTSSIDEDALPITALQILLVSRTSVLCRQEVITVPSLSVHVCIALSGLDRVCS